MGGQQSRQIKQQSVKNVKNVKNNRSFGSIHDPQNPRPGYHKKKDGVVYSAEYLELDTSEINTFKTCKYGYAISHLGVFYKGKRIKADQFTFKCVTREEVLKNVKDPSLKSLNSVLGVDIDPVTNQNRYYHKGVLVQSEV